MAKDSLSHPTLTVLEQTPIIIEKLLLDVPDATLTWKPSAQRWSIGEVLSHMSGVERVFRERSRRMIEEDSPALPSYDQNAACAAGEYPNGRARVAARVLPRARPHCYLDALSARGVAWAHGRTRGAGANHFERTLA